MLQRLLGAREPIVRVTGAVYLCFEDKGEGLKALAALTKLPGDAGAWAALTLARRGDKSAMPRALDVFIERGPYGMAGVPHRNLQKRLLEFLSNSAAASGLQLPLDWNPQYAEYESDPPYGAYAAWWQANADRITLRDPWLEMLAKEKID